MENKQIYLLIPAFNEESVIKDVILEAQKAGYSKIIVIDDGSTDQTSEKALENGVIVLQHAINRGKGAAIKTGMGAAKLLEAEIIITMDGDGQHNPADIAKMLIKIQAGYDVVLGTRMKNSLGMPSYKIFANYIGNFFTWIIFGLWVTDSQSGFRAYSKKAFSLIDTKADRYDYDSEIIREIQHHRLKFIEVPIEVRYTQYSMSKKNKQNLKNGFKTLIKMLITN